MDLIERAIQEELKGAILKTVAFFDLFDYPLTILEIYKYLYWPAPEGAEKNRQKIFEDLNFSRVQSCTKILYTLNILDLKNGFYFIKGREAVIEARLKRYNYTGHKIKRAKRIIRIFSFLPFIKMVAVGNLIGAHNFRKESDIDLFIITDKNRVWGARFFSTAIAALLNLRPKKGNAEDKICLSFFIGDQCLNLKNIAGKEDVYFYYWLAGLVPIYSRGDIYSKFIESNFWVSSKLPNFKPAGEGIRCSGPTLLGELFGRIISFIFGWLEPLFRSIQIKALPGPVKARLSSGTDVIAGAEIIKLHVNDRRKYYREAWQSRVRTLKPF